MFALLVYLAAAAPTPPASYAELQLACPESHQERDYYVLALLQDRCEGAPVVARLPTISPIEVLLADREGGYLVRTSFGVTGWVHVQDGSVFTPMGLRFAGD